MAKKDENLDDFLSDFIKETKKIKSEVKKEVKSKEKESAPAKGKSKDDQNLDILDDINEDDYTNSLNDNNQNPVDELSPEERLQKAEATSKLISESAAEFLASFLVVFLTIFITAVTSLGYLTTVITLLPLAIFFIYALAFFIIQPISGGYINPIITLIGLLQKKLDTAKFWLFLGLQFLGGILASALVYLLLPTNTSEYFSGSINQVAFSNFVANGYEGQTPLALYATLSGSTALMTFSVFAAIIVEVLAAALITFIFLAVTNRFAFGKVKGAFFIGISYAVSIYITFLIDGSGLNPARSLGAALIAQDWSSFTGTSPLAQLWVFIIFPFVGALIAYGIYSIFNPSPEKLIKEAIDEYEAEEFSFDDLDLDDIDKDSTKGSSSKKKS